MAAETRGVERGSPLSAGSLETRGFKCVLYGAFFAQESSCGYGAHSPIKRGCGAQPHIKKPPIGRLYNQWFSTNLYKLLKLWYSIFIGRKATVVVLRLSFFCVLSLENRMKFDFPGDTTLSRFFREATVIVFWESFLCVLSLENRILFDFPGDTTLSRFFLRNWKYLLYMRKLLWVKGGFGCIFLCGFMI